MTTIIENGILVLEKEKGLQKMNRELLLSAMNVCKELRKDNTLYMENDYILVYDKSSTEYRGKIIIEGNNWVYKPV